MSSEYQTHGVASIIEPIRGEVVVCETDITRSLQEKNLGAIAIGNFADKSQREIMPDEHGIAYVKMNSSGRMELEQCEDGVIATSALADCTGVAGFARRRDGSVAAFISHYDPMCQHSRLTGTDSPVNQNLYSFQYQSQRDGVELDSPLLYVVAYPDSAHHDLNYGQKMGVFKDWHYVDQINTTANQLSDNARVLLLPYQLMSKGHTLASGRVDGQEGIFWDGVRIDFEAYLAPEDSTAADKKVGR